MQSSYAWCCIIKVMVHIEIKHVQKTVIWQHNALLVSKAKIDVSWKNFNFNDAPKKEPRMIKKNSKMLSFVFQAILSNNLNGWTIKLKNWNQHFLHSTSPFKTGPLCLHSKKFQKNILRQTLYCSAKLQFFPHFRSFGGIDTEAGRRKRKAEFMSYTSGILSKNLRHLLPSGAASNLATIIPYSSIV